MGKIATIYFGGISKIKDTYKWNYGAIQVKETAKRYQMLKEANLQNWHGGYEGMIIPKDKIETFGKLLSWRGHFSLVDDELRMKKWFKKDIGDYIKFAEARMKNAKNKGEEAYYNFYKEQIKGLKLELSSLEE